MLGMLSRDVEIERPESISHHMKTPNDASWDQDGAGPMKRVLSSELEDGRDMNRRQSRTSPFVSPKLEDGRDMNRRQSRSSPSVSPKLEDGPDINRRQSRSSPSKEHVTGPASDGRSSRRYADRLPSVQSQSTPRTTTRAAPSLVPRNDARFKEFAPEHNRPLDSQEKSNDKGLGKARPEIGPSSSSHHEDNVKSY